MLHAAVYLSQLQQYFLYPDPGLENTISLYCILCRIFLHTCNFLSLFIGFLLGLFFSLFLGIYLDIFSSFICRIFSISFLFNCFCSAPSFASSYFDEAASASYFSSVFSKSIFAAPSSECFSSFSFVSWYSDAKASSSVASASAFSSAF